MIPTCHRTHHPDSLRITLNDITIYRQTNSSTFWSRTGYSSIYDLPSDPLRLSDLQECIKHLLYQLNDPIHLSKDLT